MTDRAEAVRRAYETRVMANGDQNKFRAFAADRDLGFLRKPAERAGIPAAVLEACDFYYANVLEPDNGNVHVFRVLVDGQPTFGVQTMMDGSDAHLEVFDGDGTALGAARIYCEFVLWQDRDRVRLTTTDRIVEPELDAARERWARKTSAQHPPPAQPAAKPPADLDSGGDRG